eukprot:TRINITY_DN10908_c0_g1_i1.p1 TRINITY_DN10908_c0_g1~~TRINITY_DN10908_c0_g1_i1.p1  ORF type:complete len:388 (-),score=38.87 TRINITY_DN10908_c0_g1_i1:5-1126(-)
MILIELLVVLILVVAYLVFPAEDAETGNEEEPRRHVVHAGDAAPLPTRTRRPAPPPPLRPCGVCYEYTEKQQTCCGSGLCDLCLRAYVETSIDAAQTPLLCPCRSCWAPLNVADIRAAVERPRWERYNDRLLWLHLAFDDKIVHCPAQDCGMVFEKGPCNWAVCPACCAVVCCHCCVTVPDSSVHTCSVKVRPKRTFIFCPHCLAPNHVTTRRKTEVPIDDEAVFPVTLSAACANCGNSLEISLESTSPAQHEPPLPSAVGRCVLRVENRDVLIIAPSVTDYVVSLLLHLFHGCIKSTAEAVLVLGAVSLATSIHNYLWRGDGLIAFSQLPDLIQALLILANTWAKPIQLAATGVLLIATIGSALRSAFALLQ